jgi:hypothetical protein
MLVQMGNGYERPGKEQQHARFSSDASETHTNLYHWRASDGWA